DSGFAFVSRPEVHAASMSHSAAYLTGSTEQVTGSSFVLGSSRRGRGFAVWAALRELGREGVADLVDRCCRHARHFAEVLTAGGARIVNDVVLNQVLVDVNADADAVAAAVREEGTCWLGATTWRGQRLLRISVSNYATTTADIERSAEAILRVAERVRAETAGSPAVSGERGVESPVQPGTGARFFTACRPWRCWARTPARPDHGAPLCPTRPSAQTGRRGCAGQQSTSTSSPENDT